MVELKRMNIPSIVNNSPHCISSALPLIKAKIMIIGGNTYAVKRWKTKKRKIENLSDNPE